MAMSDTLDQHALYRDHDSGDTVPVAEMLAARQVALDLLYGVLDQKKLLDQALSDDGGFAGLPVRDRAFCRMLVSTTLRRLGQIDDILGKAIDRPSSTAQVLMHILRLGTAQILFMNVPDHAAVDTSVRMAEAAGMERQKGFVNGVLRTVTRSGQEWMSRQDEARLGTPEWLLKIWVVDYGLRTAAEIAKANLIEAPLDISIRDESERAYWGGTLKASEIGAGTLRRPSGGNVVDLPGFHDGRWWVQDASAAIPAALFGDVEGKRVVDLCAAPGGKTMQLAARGAHVVAIDRSAGRLKKLRENVERIRLADRVDVVVADGAAWNPKDKVDMILLDAPCSATGTVRRNPDVLHLKGERDLERLERVQENILEHAFEILAPGGVLIYCTCSLQKAEGEYQIAKFLERHPEASKIAISAQEVGDLEEIINEDGDLRILPFHRAAQGGMDGFFVSRLRKR
jgi:16S rRNA (cytosine967-C5)-methyltransferase